MAVRAVAAPLAAILCRADGCPRFAAPPDELCRYHRSRRRLMESGELGWLAETEDERLSRLSVLKLTDDLLGQIEEANLTCPTAPAAAGLVIWYSQVGGGPVWDGAWPSGPQLLDAVLGLQEDLLRRPARQR